MATKVTAVIPARLGSKRFPGKVLYPFKGKPLLYYVYKELSKSKHINRLVIATDDNRIKSTAEGFGAEVITTSKKHKTGSDRAAEVLKKIGGDIIINIQADNFGLKTTLIDRVIEKMKSDKNVKFASLAYRLDNDEDLFDPDKVKLLTDKENNALWFSRYPLPYLQNATKGRRFNQFKFMGHIGVYFFRRQGLLKFADWKRGELEKAESLEQLRILENGEKIKIYTTKLKSISVDSKDDLKKIDSLYK